MVWRPPAIVTLTRFPDIFAGLHDSLEQFDPGVERFAITSGPFLPDFAPPGWIVSPGIEPFVFARNANLGLQLAGERDILLINDDCRLLGPTVDRLAAIARAYSVGLLSPQIRGDVGNPFQRERAQVSGACYTSALRLAFVCIYLPWATRDRIGLLDERFTEYGGDDVDYCCRVRQAGLSLAVTSDVVVQHGADGHGASSSYLRLMSEAQRVAAFTRMDALVAQKHFPEHLGGNGP